MRYAVNDCPTASEVFLLMLVAFSNGNLQKRLIYGLAAWRGALTLHWWVTHLIGVRAALLG